MAANDKPCNNSKGSTHHGLRRTRSASDNANQAEVLKIQKKIGATTIRSKQTPTKTTAPLLRHRTTWAKGQAREVVTTAKSASSEYTLVSCQDTCDSVVRGDRQRASACAAGQLFVNLITFSRRPQRILVKVHIPGMNSTDFQTPA